MTKVYRKRSLFAKWTLFLFYFDNFLPPFDKLCTPSHNTFPCSIHEITQSNIKPKVYSTQNIQHSPTNNKQYHVILLDIHFFTTFLQTQNTPQLPQTHRPPEPTMVRCDHLDLKHWSNGWLFCQGGKSFWNRKGLVHFRQRRGVRCGEKGEQKNTIFDVFWKICKKLQKSRFSWKKSRGSRWTKRTKMNNCHEVLCHSVGNCRIKCGRGVLKRGKEHRKRCLSDRARWN